MDDRELEFTLHLAWQQHERGEVVDDQTLAAMVRKLSAARYGGFDAVGDEKLAGVLLDHGSKQDAAEGALAALKIEPGLGHAPVGPKRRAAWASRQVAVVQTERPRRRAILSLAAGVALAWVLFSEGPRDDHSHFDVPAAVSASFDELMQELSGTEVVEAPAPPTTSLTWLTGMLTNVASDFASGYRRGRTRLRGSAEQVSQELLRFAEAEKIQLQWECPPPARDGTRFLGDYRWPRKIRICPGLSSLEATAVGAHELAHHLQGVEGRLGRKGKEEEADAVALVALKALAVKVKARDGAYLAKPGDHVAGLREARSAIEQMAAVLVRAVEGGGR